MTSTLRYFVLCLTGLAAACSDEASDPAAPGRAEVVPAAAVENVVGAPKLGLSSHALYYCYTPGGNRMCVVLKHQVRITSTGNPLKWTAAKNQLWIVVSPAGGTTPTNVTVSVDRGKLPPWGYAHGMVTISAAGASNSPQTIWVEKNPWGGP